MIIIFINGKNNWVRCEVINKTDDGIVEVYQTELREEGYDDHYNRAVADEIPTQVKI